MKRLLFLSALFFLSGSIAAQSVKENERIQGEIRSLLDAQVKAWNRGDIRGFMEGYHQSDKLVFISGDSITRGWRPTLERYKRSYDTRERMGDLSFSDLEIQVLSRHLAVVIGSWTLARRDERLHGKFSLVLRRFKSGWRIVIDHTS